MFIFAVAIKSPLYTTFDYQSKTKICVGSRVLVNFSGREVIAIILELKQQSRFKLKNIIKIIDTSSILSKKTLDLINWCANYYVQPIGEVVFSAIPKKLRIGADVNIKKSANKQKQIRTNIKLNIEQSSAIQIIKNSLEQYQAFLLHGITGSGKTEVYLQVAKKVLDAGKQVLVLVPEIGLTPQMITRFSTRLDTKVVAIHSSLNVTQKLDSWESARRGECGVILGTRSAIWTEIFNLGLIIVDEEHDSSFKQQSSPRYSAKSLSFVRAKNENIPLILGSATPSLETLKLLIDKKIIHIVLRKRASGNLPTINIINIKNEKEIISNHLQQKIKQHLANNKQVMLFINRRGYAPIYYCTSCNWQLDCSACDKPMIYHRDTHKLKCHSCDKVIHPITACGGCGANTLQIMGYGTQRLEENLSTKFYGTEIIRIDKDSTTKKTELNKKLERIKTGESCIIIGTQMLAKGHDFAGITLVGVLDSDGSLLSTNFRATEYLIQLLIQVAGRAGRSQDDGEVIIQTKYADYAIFNFVKHHNYTGFAKELLIERRNSLMPPFSHNALICANAKLEEKAKNYLLKCKKVLEIIQIDEVNIFAVIKADTQKKANYYYYHLNLYSKNRQKLAIILKTFLQNMPKAEYGVRWFIDVDPLD